MIELIFVVMVPVEEVERAGSETRALCAEMEQVREALESATSGCAGKLELFRGGLRSVMSRALRSEAEAASKAAELQSLSRLVEGMVPREQLTDALSEVARLERMMEDMTVRNLSPATQRSYIHAVSKFSRHFGRSPDRLGLEDIHAFQVHLVSTRIAWPSLNQIDGVERPRYRQHLKC